MRIIIDIEEGRVTGTSVDGVPFGPGSASPDASLVPPPDLLRRATALGAVSAGPATLRPGNVGAGGIVGGAAPAEAASGPAPAAARTGRGGRAAEAGAPNPGEPGDAGGAPVDAAVTETMSATRPAAQVRRAGAKRAKRRR